MIDTMISVTTNIAADRGHQRDGAVVNVLLRQGQEHRVQVPGDRRCRDPRDDGQHFAGEPTDGSQKSRDHDDAEDDEVQNRKGHEPT